MGYLGPRGKTSKNLLRGNKTNMNLWPWSSLKLLLALELQAQCGLESTERDFMDHDSSRATISDFPSHEPHMLDYRLAHPLFSLPKKTHESEIQAVWRLAQHFPPGLVFLETIGGGCWSSSSSSVTGPPESCDSEVVWVPPHFRSRECLPSSTGTEQSHESLSHSVKADA